MAHQLFNTEQFLAWLGETLRNTGEADVEIMVADDRPHRSITLHVIVRGLRNPPAGLEVKAMDGGSGRDGA